MPQLSYRRPKKTIFQLSIIPSGKKYEDTDHLTSPTEAAPVGQRRRTRGDRSRSIIPLISLSLFRSLCLLWGQTLLSSHRQGELQHSVQLYNQMLQEVTVRRLTLHVVTSSILFQVSYSEQILQFPSLPQASFCEGTSKGVTWPKVKQDHSRKNRTT